MKWLAEGISLDDIEAYFEASDLDEIAKAKEDKPPEFILIPVGVYNGIDLPDCIIDEDYTVWQEIENPELFPEE